MRWYIGNALAGYLDFCVGVFIAAAFAAAGGQTPSAWLLAWGAVWALLPDIDIVAAILKKRVDFDHRATPMHSPLLVVSTAILLMWVAGIDHLYTAVAVTGLLWHYIHDTPDGVMWLWPYSREKFLNPGPMPPHEAWTDTIWCQFSLRGMLEISVGTAALILASTLAPLPLQVACVATGIGTILVAFVFWSVRAWQENPA